MNVPAPAARIPSDNPQTKEFSSGEKDDSGLGRGERGGPGPCCRRLRRRQRFELVDACRGRKHNHFGAERERLDLDVVERRHPGLGRRLVERRLRLLRARLATAGLLAAATAAAGCGGSGAAATPGAADELRSYVAAVERVRLPVNDLLERVDPVTEAYADHEIGAREAQRRLGRIERRFGAYATGAAEVQPVPASMRAANRAYAHTYVFEDSYLAALTAALPAREFGELPNTENRQRRAIVAWRIRLESVADSLGVKLPADIQQAGRGEIRPSPEGD